MVERDLAKVEVAGSSPVFRSQKLPPETGVFFYLFFSALERRKERSFCPGGEIGRHAGLKILFTAM